MLVITCPHCRAAVVPQTDGRCPACGRAIPALDVQPFVIQSGYGVTDDQSSRGAGPSAPFDPPAPHSAWGESPQQAHLRFWQRLIELTPHTLVTPAIVAVNVFIFMWMAIENRTVLSFHGPTLIAWGANYGPLTLDGQWWRLLACTFVHGGLIHVGLNMWVLWDIGQFVERLAGNVGYLLLYVLSGLFGSLASVYWNPGVLSVGASGAVFGAFGGLMGFVLFRHESIPKHILGRLRVSGSSFLFYNLIFGLSIPGIDMAAHAGGLVAGFASGLILSQPLDRVTVRTRTWRNIVMVALGTASLAVAVALAPADLRALLVRFSAMDKQTLETYNHAVEEFQDGKSSKAEFARTIQTQVLPPWRAVREEFDQVSAWRFAAARRESLTEIKRYLLLRELAWETLATALPKDDFWHIEEAKQNNAAADRLRRQLEAGQ